MVSQKYMLKASDQEKKNLTLSLLCDIKKAFPERKWRLEPETDIEESFDGTYTYILGKSERTRYSINERTGWFKRRCAVRVFRI